MTALRAALAVPTDRAERYRAEGLWDGRTLADGIEAAAARRPRALALADNDLRFTYEELSGLVAAGVAKLASYGVCAGDGVVLIAGNSADAVIAYHALLRIGVTIVLLDRRCGTADIHLALATLRNGARVVVPATERGRLLAEFDSLTLTSSCSRCSAARALRSEGTRPGTSRTATYQPSCSSHREQRTDQRAWCTRSTR